MSKRSGQRKEGVVKVRRKARALALQALYEMDSTNHPLEVVISFRLEDTPLPEPGADFMQRLVRGVWEQREMLDATIGRIAPEWPVEQMALIDRNILRIAGYEILVSKETPLKVAINEAVELAKLFGSESSRRFINGALGTLVGKSEPVLVG
ncbi:MAG: transcription antitermination factor NusB [Chloroflexi bacterium]|nr:transcription antitermination factor NusB [Chloroflexota bacterium]